MKPLILAALIAAPAFGQTITHIAEYGTHRVTIGDEPCPANRALGVAVWSTPKESARACYWTGSDGLIRFDWYQRGSKRALPVVLPASDFKEPRP